VATIELEGIAKDYGHVRAVHDVNLQIADGEFVVLVGPSGCGKSTILRMMAGLEEITAGTLKIGGAVMNDVEPRGRDVAMVFQDYALYPHMSVRDNVGFGLKMRGAEAGDISDRVAHAARVLKIEAYLDRRPGQLSGGQRQRVAMGRAIVREPAVFLFDEPLSNLDAKLRVEMRTQIKRLREVLHTTTVYVTHDQVEAMTLADRVVILNDGRIAQQGTPMEIYNRPQSRFVAEFIGSPQMNILDAEVDRSGGRPVLRIDDAAIDIGEVDLAHGDHVDVGLRPEHLSFAEPDNVRFRTTLDVFESLGSDTMAICLLAGQELTARLDPLRELKPRQPIDLTFDSTNLHLFDAATGARLKVGSA